MCMCATMNVSVCLFNLFKQSMEQFFHINTLLFPYAAQTKWQSLKTSCIHSHTVALMCSSRDQHVQVARSIDQMIIIIMHSSCKALFI